MHCTTCGSFGGRNKNSILAVQTQSWAFHPKGSYWSLWYYFWIIQDEGLHAASGWNFTMLSHWRMLLVYPFPLLLRKFNRSNTLPYLWHWLSSNLLCPFISANTSSNPLWQKIWINFACLPHIFSIYLLLFIATAVNNCVTSPEEILAPNKSLGFQARFLPSQSTSTSS